MRTKRRSIPRIVASVLTKWIGQGKSLEKVFGPLVATKIWPSQNCLKSTYSGSEWNEPTIQLCRGICLFGGLLFGATKLLQGRNMEPKKKSVPQKKIGFLFIATLPPTKRPQESFSGRQQSSKVVLCTSMLGSVKGRAPSGTKQSNKSTCAPQKMFSSSPSFPPVRSLLDPLPQAQHQEGRRVFRRTEDVLRKTRVNEGPHCPKSSDRWLHQHMCRLFAQALRNSTKGGLTSSTIVTFQCVALKVHFHSST